MFTSPLTFLLFLSLLSILPSSSSACPPRPTAPGQWVEVLPASILPLDTSAACQAAFHWSPSNSSDHTCLSTADCPHAYNNTDGIVVGTDSTGKAVCCPARAAGNSCDCSDGHPVPCLTYQCIGNNTSGGCDEFQCLSLPVYKFFPNTSSFSSSPSSLFSSSSSSSVSSLSSSGDGMDSSSSSSSYVPQQNTGGSALGSFGLLGLLIILFVLIMVVAVRMYKLEPAVMPAITNGNAAEGRQTLLA